MYKTMPLQLGEMIKTYFAKLDSTEAKNKTKQTHTREKMIYLTELCEWVPQFPGQLCCRAGALDSTWNVSGWGSNEIN